MSVNHIFFSDRVAESFQNKAPLTYKLLLNGSRLWCITKIFFTVATLGAPLAISLVLDLLSGLISKITSASSPDREENNPSRANANQESQGIDWSEFGFMGDCINMVKAKGNELHKFYVENSVLCKGVGTAAAAITLKVMGISGVLSMAFNTVGFGLNTSYFFASKSFGVLSFFAGGQPAPASFVESALSYFETPASLISGFLGYGISSLTDFGWPVLDFTRTNPMLATSVIFGAKFLGYSAPEKILLGASDLLSQGIQKMGVEKSLISMLPDGMQYQIGRVKNGVGNTAYGAAVGLSYQMPMLGVSAVGVVGKGVVHTIRDRKDAYKYLTDKVSDFQKWVSPTVDTTALQQLREKHKDNPIVLAQINQRIQQAYTNDSFKESLIKSLEKEIKGLLSKKLNEFLDGNRDIDRITNYAKDPSELMKSSTNVEDLPEEVRDVFADTKVVKYREWIGALQGGASRQEIQKMIQEYARDEKIIKEVERRERIINEVESRERNREGFGQGPNFGGSSSANLFASGLAAAAAGFMGFAQRQGYPPQGDFGQSFSQGPQQNGSVVVEEVDQHDNAILSNGQGPIDESSSS